MIGRRTNVRTTKSPTRTGGDDAPRGNCDGLAARMAPNPTPFDVLIERTQGESRALAAARAEVLSERLCGGCPLRDASCWPKAHANGAAWFLALRGKPVSRHGKERAA